MTENQKKPLDKAHKGTSYWNCQVQLNNCAYYI